MAAAAAGHAQAHQQLAPGLAPDWVHEVHPISPLHDQDPTAGAHRRGAGEQQGVQVQVALCYQGRGELGCVGIHDVEREPEGDGCQTEGVCLYRQGTTLQGLLLLLLL